MITHPTASAVILTDDRVLLLKSTKGTGSYIYPGGHVENEDPATAVLREIREETGLDVELLYRPCFSHPKVAEVPRPFMVMDIGVRDKQIGRHRHIDAVYLARPLAGEVVLNHESSGYLWVPVDEVAALAVPEELPDLITAAAAYAASLVP
ncbi:NUDIX domain-containing protein [Actinocorallia libanotica]|uniref:NUDIX domain-containing protein n=1 Tax=Actinocorallia libanotica TaxID=46162 RepID=A0ABP4BW92_9ACTN